MRAGPAVHYSMGGLWVDYEATPDGLLDRGSPRNHMTSIPGLYAVGEADYQYHGANRIGANSLLSCVFSGLVAGPATLKYAENGTGGAPSSLFDSERKRWEEDFDRLRGMEGTENPFGLWRELGEMMDRDCAIARENSRLKESIEQLRAFKERWKNCNVLDNARWNNQSILFLNQLRNAIELAEIVVHCALHRDECRGAHYKPQFHTDDPPEGKASPRNAEYMRGFSANNERWLKTSMAEYTPDGPKISYEKVDVSLIEPVPRHYE